MIGHIHSTESFGAADGPGVRFIVFMQGCHMRCRYCHNPDTWKMDGGDEVTADEILKRALRFKPYWGKDGGITISGGEPLLQIDFVIELFKKAKELGINTCIDTAGNPFTKEEPFFSKFEELMKYTDLLLLDLKEINPARHKDLTGFDNSNIIEMAKYLSEINKPVWIRHVVVPNITENEKYLYDLGYYIGGLKNLKALDVLPYHDMGKIKYENLGIDYPLKDTKPLPRERAIEAKKIVLQGIKDRRLEENK